MLRRNTWKVKTVSAVETQSSIPKWKEEKKIN